MCACINRFGQVLRIWDHFAILRKNCNIEKFDLFSNNSLLKETCPKFLKIIQETLVSCIILIWAFKKSTLETDKTKSCFFWVCLSCSNIWMSLKKIFTNFLLGTLFFKNFNYHSIWKCKRLKISVSWRRKKIILILDPKTPRLTFGLDRSKNFFFQLCYLIRVEHKKAMKCVFDLLDLV